VVYFAVAGLVCAYHTATHCNSLQHTVTRCNSLQQTTTHCEILQLTTNHCNTLQHAAAHYNKLHYTATRCHTLQHIPLARSAKEWFTSRWLASSARITSIKSRIVAPGLCACMRLNKYYWWEIRNESRHT